jgi:uncharacterized protein (DUF2141 family)
MSFAGASKYPTRIAYEIQNDQGEILKQGFFKVVDAKSIYRVALEVSEKFAVQIYEDANGNSKMDRGWFTQPLEKYAFSNDAWETLAKPDLQSMLVHKTGEKTRMNLTLKSVTDF